MRVLVAYASRHGATAGIAERIGVGLRLAELDVDVLKVTDPINLRHYDAVVLGAAAYMFHWLKDATAFARHNRKALRARPLWLFSSGPLGNNRVDSQGHDVATLARPAEFDELVDLLAPRGERVFFGAYNPKAAPIGLGEQVVRRMPAARDALQAGDFRDWEEIDLWAAQIAAELNHTPAPQLHHR